MMTLDDVRRPECRLFEAISGSRAYGLATAESDTDIRGVFVQPEGSFLGLTREMQVANETNDIVFYELGRFAELLANNNPNLLELLFTPADCIVFRHPLMDRLPAALFLSRRCFESFAAYAMAQVRKARGLNKKIVNPMPDERRGVLAFCHVLEGQGSVPLEAWLTTRGLTQRQIGLVAVPHMRDVFGLYIDPDGSLGYRGVVVDDDATEVRVSSVEKGAPPAGWMSFNKDGFKKYCKDWREYREWVQKRNDSRYRQTEAHGQGYDAKNLMHTFRLLTLAEEIARTGSLTLRVADPALFRQIRGGGFTYEWLLEEAERRLERIEALFTVSALPLEPCWQEIDAAVVAIRRAFWKEVAQAR